MGLHTCEFHVPCLLMQNFHLYEKKAVEDYKTSALLVNLEVKIPSHIAKSFLSDCVSV